MVRWNARRDRVLGSAIEPLEGRRLLAATAFISNGVLTIAGTDAADSITVGYSVDKTRFAISIGGKKSLIAIAGVTGVLANLGGGDDFFDSHDLTLPTTVSGGDGNDAIFTGFADDRIHGDLGNDTCGGGSGKDSIYGDDGDDSLRGNSGSDSLNGGNGDDTIGGDNNNDRISGGAGSDRIRGGSGTDDIKGNGGRDFLAGNDDNDTITGGDGNDVLAGGGGDDSVNGQDGDDDVSGDDGNDTVMGGRGRDRCHGGKGDDSVRGGDDDDDVFGDDGDDDVSGDAGEDSVVGGAGNDDFDPEDADIEIRDRHNGTGGEDNGNNGHGRGDGERDDDDPLHDSGGDGGGDDSGGDDDIVVTAVQRTDANSMTAHEQMVAKAQMGGIDTYMMGDSIARRWGTSDAAWAANYANWKENFWGWNAGDFGWGADSLENMLWRAQNGELDGVNPKVIIIEGGTNNVGSTPGGQDKIDYIVACFKALIKTCKEKAPDAKIILTGIFPRNDPSGSNLAVIPEINAINDKLAALADNQKIYYVNVNDKLADASGKLYAGMTIDNLHLSVQGYQIWADALNPLLESFLGPRASTDTAPPPTGDPSAQ